MIEVEVHYFASLREARGRASETLSAEPGSVRSLFDSLAEKHSFPLDSGHCRAAVNDAFASWDAELNDGDKVAFIPPVAGG